MKINIINHYCWHKRHYGLPWNSTNTLKMYLDAFKHAYYFTDECDGFSGAIRFQYAKNMFICMTLKKII